jgi:hypothetical protein
MKDKRTLRFITEDGYGKRNKKQEIRNKKQEIRRKTKDKRPLRLMTKYRCEKKIRNKK